MIMLTKETYPEFVIISEDWEAVHAALIHSLNDFQWAGADHHRLINDEERRGKDYCVKEIIEHVKGYELNEYESNELGEFNVV